MSGDLFHPVAGWFQIGVTTVRHLPTMMPQALTSPISFLSATPPPDSFSAAASLAEPAVLLRCLAPSVILMAVYLSFLFSDDLSINSYFSSTWRRPVRAPASPRVRASLLRAYKPRSLKRATLIWRGNLIVALSATLAQELLSAPGREKTDSPKITRIKRGKKLFVYRIQGVKPRPQMHSWRPARLLSRRLPVSQVLLPVAVYTHIKSGNQAKGAYSRNVPLKR